MNAFDMLDCRTCPRHCGADRYEGGSGQCHTDHVARVSGFFPHFGEESCLVGQGGSGTIFFAGCNLNCRFCHSAGISHSDDGTPMSPDVLATAMIGLQAVGAANVHLVTPSHVTHQVILALRIAKTKGLTLPVVYNTSGYDSVKTLKQLEGLVDIYLPDLKTLDYDRAERWLTARGYPDVAKAAITEMQRQVGDLVVGENGLASRGLLVRHLVMPGPVLDAERVFSWLSRFVSPNTAVSVMSQYRPGHDADKNPDLSDINRRTSKEEHAAAVAAANQYGLMVVSAR